MTAPRCRTSYADHRLDLRESRLTKLLALLADERRGRLLDIGCAAGELAELLQTLGWQAEGVDREPALVERARGRGIAVRRADFERDPLPWDSATFDAAVAGEVIEHVIDTDHLLHEAARVLRPNGVLIVTTPNLASLENRVRLLLGRYPMWMDHGIEGSGHLRYYTPGLLQRQLEQHGFRVERHVGNWVPFLPQRWVDDRKWPWLAVTGDWWPSLAMGILMKARRSMPA
ncbi:MAG TPA: class I SAM-dependent methyltransferase [Methylomirabilota bacterium]|nr:class I SAM-dependent methyltransferase [Methylomirabilota bacterium]